MATTRDDIKRWLEEGKREGAVYMIVATDTYDYEDYPVYVLRNTSVTAEIERLRKEPMTKVMEVYSYKEDLDEQLDEVRTWRVA